MDLFGIGTLGLISFWFSDMFFRLLVAVLVIVFAYFNFGANKFLRNTLIVLAVVLVISVVFVGINFLIIIPAIIGNFFSSIMAMFGILF